MNPRGWEILRTRRLTCCLSCNPLASEDDREDAAIWLGEVGDARAVEPLITALNHSAVHVREAAGKSLGKLRDRRAVEALIEAFCTGAWEPSAYGQALGQLGERRPPSKPPVRTRARW